MLWQERFVRPVVAQLAHDAVHDPRVIGDHRAAVAEAAQVLLDDEAGADRVAQLADLEAVAARADALRVIFDHQQLVLVRDLADGLHVRALPVEVHRHNRLGLGRDGRLDLGGSMQFVCGSESTNTAVAPAIQMASAVAKNVFGCGDAFVARARCPAP